MHSFVYPKTRSLLLLCELPFWCWHCVIKDFKIARNRHQVYLLLIITVSHFTLVLRSMVHIRTQIGGTARDMDVLLFCPGQLCYEAHVRLNRIKIFTQKKVISRGVKRPKSEANHSSLSSSL